MSESRDALDSADKRLELLPCIPPSYFTLLPPSWTPPLLPSPAARGFLGGRPGPDEVKWTESKGEERVRKV